MLPNLCTLVEAMVCGKTWNHKVLSQLCLGSDEKLSLVATRGLESTGPHEGAMLRERLSYCSETQVPQALNGARQTTSSALAVMGTP